MSDYSAKVVWRRAAQENFVDNKYSREHLWKFDGGACVAASASPNIVPLPYSVAQNVDPEEAFIASVSSCHMLFFLAQAAKRKLLINDYEDNAIGVMKKNSGGKISITDIQLNVKVVFAEGILVTKDVIEDMHHLSHEQCFIANSIKGQVTTNIIE
jgi:organic hydroperoxide reductase OsmC/OhrA